MVFTDFLDLIVLIYDEIDPFIILTYILFESFNLDSLPDVSAQLHNAIYWSTVFTKLSNGEVDCKPHDFIKL